MIIANVITTFLTTPWMAALGAAILTYTVTQDMKNEGRRFLFVIIAASIGAIVIYPIHKSIKEERSPEMNAPTFPGPIRENPMDLGPRSYG